MSRARTFADLATASEGTSLASRNMIGNGAFNIWQKGFTSTTTGSGGGKPIDRWRNGQSNVGQLSTETSRVADSPDTFPGSYSFKIQVKTPESSFAANEDMTILTKVEGTDCQRLLYGTSSAKTTTLSFWVKSSIAGTFAVGIYQTDGNDNISKPYTINSADTWEHKTITYPGNTAAAINDDNTEGLQIQWFISAGSNITGGSNGDVWHSYADNTFAFGHVTNTHITTDESTFQITGVQFELGEVATPFELMPIADDLARCQRYLFVPVKKLDPAQAYFGLGLYYNSSQVQVYISHPVEMRAKPSLVCTDSSNHFAIFREGAGDYLDTLVYNSGNTKFTGLYNSDDASGNAGHARGVLHYDGGSSGTVFMHLDAEL